jgi:hypothetical protein
MNKNKYNQQNSRLKKNNSQESINDLSKDEDHLAAEEKLKACRQVSTFYSLRNPTYHSLFIFSSF